MRILGVDPGLTRCGLGVIDAGASRDLSLVAVTVAATDASLETPRRISLIAEAVEAALDAHRPDVVALERVFAQHNVRTVMGTAQVSGVVMLAAERRGLPIALYTPSEVKAAVTGSGRAEKAQVGAMVRRLLGPAVPERPADALDALAIAICHAWRGATVGDVGGVSTPAQARWAEAQEASRHAGVRPARPSP